MSYYGVSIYRAPYCFDRGTEEHNLCAPLRLCVKYLLTRLVRTFADASDDTACRFLRGKGGRLKAYNVWNGMYSSFLKFLAEPVEKYEVCCGKNYVPCRENYVPYRLNYVPYRVSNNE